MKELASKIYLRHKNFWSKDNFSLLIKGILFFAFALLIQHFAYNYLDYHVKGTPVGDLLLNNLPTVNLDIFIVQGALVLTFIVISLFIIHPEYLPFSVKTLALFLITRSFFLVWAKIKLPHKKSGINILRIEFILFLIEMNKIRNSIDNLKQINHIRVCQRQIIALICSSMFYTV